MPRAKVTIDLAKLTTDLVEARTVGLNAVKGMKDGGTCCFDCPTISLPYSRSPRVRAEIEAAIVAAGYRPSPGYGWSKGTTMLHGFPGDHAQGSPRTLGAEAVSKFLAERG
jgi:hypothetical protein